MVAAGAQWHNCVLSPLARLPRHRQGGDATSQEGSQCWKHLLQVLLTWGVRGGSGLGFGGGLGSAAKPFAIPIVLGLTCEPPRAGGDGEVAVPRPASDAAPSPCGLQGGWEAGAWLVSCGECPAKAFAINKSIIKGGYTLALEHAPGRAYFRPLGKRVRGGEVGGCKGPRSAGERGGLGAGGGGSAGWG